MIFIDNQTKLKVPKKLLKKITKTLTDKDLELIICDNEYIKELNKNSRGINKATDVLSFPLVDEINFQKSIGTIVISEDYVRDGAVKFQHKKRDELTLLFIHGVLHLLRYDHETDNGKMRKLEKSIIKKFGLPQSLIVRTGN